jgi:hypothetical protein
MVPVHPSVKSPRSTPGVAPFGFALCLIFIASVLPLFGQTETATLSGTIVDQTGAVVPGVNVTLTNEDTNTVSQGITTSGGVYSVPGLKPGRYRMTVEKDGFKRVSVRDIILNVQEVANRNFQLELGGLSETVQVEGGVSLVNTQDAAVSTVVDRQFAENLPLNGRSFQSLIELTPGVIPTVTVSGELGQFSVNGQRANSNYFTVDGVGANVAARLGPGIGQAGNGSLPALTTWGGTNNLVSIDALEEFKVQTSTFAPEYGRTPGGQISVVTRSGTNEFHGTLFNYFRNDALDANDWFANRRSLPKPALRQNDFGGVLGGPILQDRAFFFFSYEGLRLRQPKIGITDVPSLTTRQNAPAGVRPYLNAFPVPNGPENPSTGLATFSTSYSDSSALNATSIRVDQKLTNQSHLFGRYNYAPSHSTQRLIAGSSVNTVNPTSSTTQTLTLGHTQMFTPAINNEFRFNYSRVTGRGSFELDDFGGAAVPGDSVLFPAFTSASQAQVGLTIFSGLSTGLIAGKNVDNLQRQINVVDSVSLVSGSHAIKAGVDYRRLKPFIGHFVYTQFASFFDVNTEVIAGRAASVSVGSGSTPREPIFNNLSFYAQDTWRASARLTLTYGLRWDYNPPPHEANGNEAVTVIGLEDPATVTLAPRGTELYEPTRNNFAPRIGLAYLLFRRPERETILRSGFGVFYDLGNGVMADAYRSNVFPFSEINSFANVAFPLSAQDAAAPPISTSPPVTTSLFVAEPNLKLPYTLQWNFAVEQALGSNQKFSATYLGAAGRRLIRRQSMFAPNPTFRSSIIAILNAAASDYHALQLQYQRRLSRGIQALASYAWSHSIDDVSVEAAGNPVPAFQAQRGEDRGASDFDVRHAFSAAVTYDIAAPKTNPLGNAIVQGWAIDLIAKGRSAPPFDLVGGVNQRPGGFIFLTRPNLVPGQSLYIFGQECISTFREPCPGGKAFNPAAFAAPPATQQGTLGRNVVRGFSFFQLDTTLRRHFKLTERVNLQFRADFFNILNHPNFGPPGRFLTTPSTFGRATSTYGQSLGAGGVAGGFSPLYQSGGSRSVQLSLKLQF